MALFSPLLNAQRAAWMPQSATGGLQAEQDTVNRISDIAFDPYRMPFNSKAQGLRALAGGAGRAIRGGASAGNVDMARGHGAAILGRNYDQMAQEQGDARIGNILMPFLSQYNQAYGAGLENFLNQPKKKKKQNKLKKLLGTAADTYLNYQTAGAWGAGTGGGISSRME